MESWQQNITYFNMENKNSMPITEAAEKQLEQRKQFFSEYGNQLTAYFTEKIKTAFDNATRELEFKHRELMQQSTDLLQIQNADIINPDEPTDEKTGNKKSGK